jgi:nicotinate phosphoribosyltransferase
MFFADAGRKALLRRTAVAKKFAIRKEPRMPNNPGPPSLLTDLYEFTMAQVYFRHRMFAPATFSLFIRQYPSHRGYFVSAGLEEVLSFLENMRYAPEDIDYLASKGLFAEDFLDYLSTLTFSGGVRAIPEGRVFFKDEPVLEVTAPIIEAQLVESAVINTMNLQINLATKVARCVHAAAGRDIVDFSLRRTHGVDAGMAVARAGYIAGLSATSNVLAGQKYDLPVSGTMAHSFITSFEEEIDAFRAFAGEFGDQTVLLIDTYDTLAGADKAVVVAREMIADGKSLRGVRLDSGDMTDLSRKVRRKFLDARLGEVKIFASGGFDEFKIARGIAEGAEIDGYGVGTKMGVSADSPYTDMAYKLVQYDGRPVMKLSSGKSTLVAPKQVFRSRSDGIFSGDTIALREEPLDGEPLLEPVFSGGRRDRRMSAPNLDACRRRCREDAARLPADTLTIENPKPLPVEVSQRLQRLQKNVKHRVIEKELGES